MGLRIVRGVALAAAISLGLGSGAEAQEPTKPSPHGAVVVALDDASTAAAKPLARAAYADVALRPAIEEAAAHALLGEAVTAPSAAVTELIELRASIPRAGSEAAGRRLLAAIGADLHAALVIAVSTEESRTTAQVVRVSDAADQNVTLLATRTEGPSGEAVFAWPNAVTTLRALVAEPAIAPLKQTSATPLVTPKEPAEEAPAFWTSPWFWGPLGGLLAVGVTVFVASKATAESDNVHVTGTVGP